MATPLYSTPGPTATVTVAARAAQVLAAGNPNPTTPPFSDDVQWITAYLAVHMLSVPSRRYSYLMWFAIALLVVLLALVRFAGLTSGALGTACYKWAIRRPILRRGLNSPRTLRIFPSHSQLLTLVGIVALTAITCCAGPDYIKPTVGTFNLGARSTLERRKWWDPLQFVGYAPQYTIHKAWWTAGGRVGMMAYALFPLCVLFALKSPPFALFAFPFTIGLHFDKLAFLHRWTGRLIWLLSTLHVIFWCLQLLKDRRTSPWAGTKYNTLRDKPLELAWAYIRFIYAWIVRLPLTSTFTSIANPCKIKGIRPPHSPPTLLHPLAPQTALRDLLLPPHHPRPAHARPRRFTPPTYLVVVLGRPLPLVRRALMALRTLAAHQRRDRCGQGRRDSPARIERPTISQDVAR